MKKYLIILLSFILFPVIVSAEECEQLNDPYCSGQSCLTSLQSEYNTWNTTGNTGKSCIKVIAMRNGNTKTYLSGKNPSNNYKCSDGSLAVSKLIYSALADEEDATECNSQTCYIPEVWLMDCGTSSSGGSTNTGNTSNTGGTVNNDNTGDVSTNNNGQITGTTDSSETGVETYFIVLFALTIISYLILTVSKKKNLFKNI